MPTEAPSATLPRVGFLRRTLGLSVIALLVARPALANGRFPAANQIVFAPTDEDLVVVRTTYGIFLSHDGGVTWSYLCEDALGLPSATSEDPALALSANDSLIAALSAPTSGLDVSTDTGCNWTCVGGPLGGQSMVDVAVRPDAPHSVVALASTFLAADAGGGTFVQIFQTTDDGATWAPLGTPLTDTMFGVSTLLATTVDVAATDPNRLYVSATVGYAAARKALLFVSDDTGQTWTERAIPDFDPTTEASLFIGAIDPSDEDRVYLRTNALATGGQSRLFVVGDATDAGASITPILAFPVAADPLGNLGELLGFALSPDGSTIYAGSRDGEALLDGVSRVRHDLPSAFAGGQVLCLATHGSQVWACSEETSGFSVGMSTDDGATFSPVLHVCDIPPPIACAASNAIACGTDANASQCGGAAFAQIAPSLGCSSADAGGSSDASAGDAAMPANADGGRSPVAASSSCGCSFLGQPAGSPFFATAGMVALAWLRRKKRPSDALR